MKRDSISPLFRPVPYIENATSDPIVADAATPEKQAIAFVMDFPELRIVITATFGDHLPILALPEEKMW